MDISVLEPKALQLPVDDRARLVCELLKSFKPGYATARFGR
jgi:hypothetical protein